MIAELLADALRPRRLPRSHPMIESTDREATGELMKLRGIVDVLVPRGGAGLISAACASRSCGDRDSAGGCHIYVHESTDFDKALQHYR